jgi:Ca-activated chloride channel homolog
MVFSQKIAFQMSKTLKYWGVFVCILLFLPPSVSEAQTAHQAARQGDKDFTNGKFKEAELNYHRAQEKGRNDQTTYNLGNAIYKQQRYDEALEAYGKIADKTQDKSLKSSSLYNQGNTHFYKNEYEKSIEDYKNALRLNPNDLDAKRNLALAKRLLEKQKQEEEKKKQQQNKDQNKDPNKDKNQQNQDKNDQNQDKNQQQNQQNQQQSQQNQQQPNPQDMKKEDAKRMLQIMDDEERKVQQRLQKGKAQPSRSTKDW